MGELLEQILAEKENVDVALHNLKTAMARKEKTVIELAAIATFLHNTYNGIENILKQILLSKDIEVPKSGTWHKDLLNRSLAARIISEKLSSKLYKYLTFRHFFVHAYGFMLDEKELEGLSHDIPEIWQQFLLEIEASFELR
ncbi:MAG: hypothetical protein O8C64_08870 [Candidatus Methanoperedens sp.]|nr:hypothetical protein [Candidatus Methanoperedens sp.]MCZ7406540.1 hypothetical protein [Candidatus Methanoperedens sp.]